MDRNLSPELAGTGTGVHTLPSVLHSPDETVLRIGPVQTPDGMLTADIIAGSASAEPYASAF